MSAVKSGNIDAKHNRFYIFRHFKGDEVQYLDSAGRWVDDFQSAEMIADHTAAKVAAADAKFELPPNSQMQLVLGQAVVDVNPFFAGEAV